MHKESKRQWVMLYDKSAGARFNLALILPLFCFLYFLRRYHPWFYVIEGCLALAAGLLLYHQWDRWRKAPIATIALVLVVLALPALGFWQFISLCDPGDSDHSGYACAFWNLERGRTYFPIANLNIFGSHANYTLVFWLPLHYLTGEVGVKLGKYLCILVMAFLVVRRYWGNREVAAWAAIALLLSPPIASQFFFGFHPEFLGLPILVLALDAYREEKLGRFLVYTAFLAYTKEVLTLAIAGILLVALIERRPWKWILWPGLLCCAQMALYWYVIVPHYSPVGNYLIGYATNSFHEAVELFFHRHTLFFALHIVMPFLPLMLVLPARYWLLPLPLFLFYSVMPIGTHDLWRHYINPLALLCMGGFILMKDDPLPEKPAGKVDGRILMACAIMSLLSYPLWRSVFSMPLSFPTRSLEVLKVKTMIPEGASLLVNGAFVAHFAGRKDVMDWVYRYKPLENFEYVVIDGTFNPEWLFREKELVQDIVNFSHSPNWSTLYSKDSLYLFRREGD